MSKTMEGMADAAWSADDPSVSGKLRNLPATEALEVRRMKAALLYLADNVSDEMVIAANSEGNGMAAKLSAALRAAAGSATPEVK